ncbi:MAG: SDR family NAD(P)-dependent oxidoreductase [Prevotella sp.]|nr:SDR family NAD(P)-dependent oxidoreductase [Prevotella sp.]
MNIFIIGATSGIGHELWQYYSSQGNRVAVVGRRKTEIDSMIRNSSTNTIGYSCDISDIKAFNDAFDMVLKEFITIDLVIVCAGIGELNPELNISTELATIRVNVEGWTNCVDKTYNLFSDQKHGHLVVVTSVGGLQPTPAAPSYSASKAYQINYIKAIQKKSKGSAINVTEIRPGLIETRMAKGEGLFWVMPLEKVTNAIIKAIDNKRSRVILNRRWRVINFILKHFM